MRTRSTTAPSLGGVGVSVALAVALFTGCSSSPTAVKTETTPIAIYVITVAAAQQSDVQDIRRLAVRDRETWARVWAELQGPQSRPAPLPEADFSREMILVATLGTKPTSGYSVEFGAMGMHSGTFEVQVKKEVPGMKCGTAQVLTSPYTVAKTARTDAPVAFVELEATTTCE